MMDYKYKIKNEKGLRAREASKLTNIAKDYPKSQIIIKKGQRTANAYSLFGLLSLGITKDDEIQIFIGGDKEEEILNKVLNYLKDLEKDDIN